MRYSPSIIELLIFFQRIAKHRLRFEHVFPGRSQCFDKGDVRFAKALPNPDIDIPCRLRLLLRAIEIVASKRQSAEGAQRIRLAKPIANRDTEISRLLQRGIESIVTGEHFLRKPRR
jgi:hypothetical protein